MNKNQTGTFISTYMQVQLTFLQFNTFKQSVYEKSVSNTDEVYSPLRLR